MALAPRAESEIGLATRQFTSLLERHMPGLLDGLHLVGSAADGDFRPGRSDLDFVAVLKQPATDADIEGLTIVHRLYASDPTLAPLCGIWITPADLAAGPDATPDGPTSSENHFSALAHGNRNPVTWFTLADTSRPLIGELDRGRLWRDPDRLAVWMRENAATYWTRWHRRSSALLTAPGLAALTRKASTWAVLGISRLHYTLATGRIASKTAAGDYALTAFGPEWHRIVEDSLRYRHGESSRYANPFARRADALAFLAMAIAAIRDYP